MTEADARNAAFQVTLLRSNALYHNAMSKVHRESAKSGAVAAMAANKRSEEYADIRLVVGTWEQIAASMQDLTDEHRSRIFRCTPVHLMWRLLEPAIEQIRRDGVDDNSSLAAPAFAREFEGLAGRYHSWAQSPAGQNFRTAEMQAVCALFG